MFAPTSRARWLEFGDSSATIMIIGTAAVAESRRKISQSANPSMNGNSPSMITRDGRQLSALTRASRPSEADTTSHVARRTASLYPSRRESSGAATITRATCRAPGARVGWKVISGYVLSRLRARSVAAKLRFSERKCSTVGAQWVR